jgi:hypothetical protein
MWHITTNGERRDETKTGFAAYIGCKRVAWSLEMPETIQKAVEAIKKQTTHNRFVPCAVIFDCALILNVAFVTDDGNGITVHNAKCDAGKTMQALSY